MKKMRLPLLIALGIFAIGLIIGSFLDLQISQAIASPTNVFGLIMAGLTPTVSFLAIGLAFGGFIALGLQKQRPAWGRALLIAGGIVGYGSMLVFTGGEYFGPNGFDMKELVWVGYIIAAVILAGGMYLGYRMFRNVTSPYAWVLLAIFLAAFFISVGSNSLILKAIFHRPRYRVLVGYPDIPFHPWWKPCADYQEWMNQFNVVSEEFKSFPSGHTTDACSFLVATTFLPLILPKARKYQMSCFVLSIAWVIFVAFTRIRVAAHFLSDVCFAATFTTLLAFLANEVVMRLKLFEPYREEDVH